MEHETGCRCEYCTVVAYDGFIPITAHNIRTFIETGFWRIIPSPEPKEAKP